VKKLFGNAVAQFNALVKAKGLSITTEP